MFSVIDLSLFACFILVIFYFINRPKKKIPPGPWNIPFYSGVFTIGAKPYETFQEWGKQYGGVVRTKFGFKEAIIIDDPKLMREAFNDPAFSGRPENRVFDVLSGGKHGISAADGEEWAEQRRFVMRTLRDFGFGKKSMEVFIMDEVTELLKWMKENEGIPVQMDRRFVLATVSSLWTLLAGERQEQDNKILDEIIDRANTVLNNVAQVNGLASVFPQLIDILPKAFLKDWYNFVDTVKPFLKIFSDAVEQHVANPVDENSPRDLIDVYLTEIGKTTDTNSSFYKERGLQTLKVVVSDLYSAGQGTTSSLLTWTVLYMVRFPESQKKLQRELDAVIGKSRMPSLTDRANLPYTEALTWEILRYATLTPFAVPHETMADTTLGGYDINKGTIVMPNLWSMSNSESVWGDPQNFRPERFLSPDGKSVSKSKDLMPFGAGKRQCAGEALGRDNYFLFLTSIFQRFSILPDPANPTPSLEASPGFFRDAQKFKVIIRERV